MGEILRINFNLLFFRILSSLIPSLVSTQQGFGALDCKDLPELKHLIVFNDNGHALKYDFC
jgi:hypothetical protein